MSLAGNGTAFNRGSIISLLRVLERSFVRSPPRACVCVIVVGGGGGRTKKSPWPTVP